jgi:8-oxo-dGTP pyrophosphatase MutT (NUDIX family)
VKDNKFHLIARAVILDKNRILLARQKGMSNTFLHGGHIETGESAVTALQREIREELGLSLKVESFLGCVEAGWEDEKRHNFEVNLIFGASLQDQGLDVPPLSCEEHLEFLWSSVDDLDKNNLLPQPLRKLIFQYLAGDDSAWWGSTLPPA